MKSKREEKENEKLKTKDNLSWNIYEKEDGRAQETIL